MSEKGDTRSPTPPRSLSQLFATASPEMAERFLREIRLQASLEHPHIAALHNAFRHRDELVMVMEFVEGVSLREKLRKPGITLAQGIEYTIQVVTALSYSHAHGVIHRDIKPSNVMIASGRAFPHAPPAWAGALSVMAPS